MKTFKQIREAKSSSGYDLYHKTFSGAMQHAYAHAKKKGYVVDKNDIDNKVATGPKKPSSGKTNKYILKTNKKNRHAHIQVANLDNKRYELNMYIESVQESVELDENRNLFKDYEQLKKKGKSDSQAQDILLSMPKYKRYDSAKLGKLIGDALRKGTIRRKPPFKMAEAVSPAQQAAIAISKKEKEQKECADEKDFKPHMMYDPKTGKGYKANTYADHVKYDKMGYTHEKPEVNEAVVKNVRGKDGKTYALELGLSGRKVTVRTKNQFGDIKTLSIKQAAKLFEDSVLESAKRDAFRAMGKQGKDAADVDDYKATADDRKAADKNIIIQLRRVADLPKGGVIEFKNGKKVNLKQNLAKAVLTKYNSIKRNDQKLKFSNMAAKSPQDLQKAMKL